MNNKYDHPFKNVHAPAESLPNYRCPCCKFKTLHGRACDEICPVCYWHDDGQDEHDADQVRGGPNYFLSLRQAQRNFVEYGAVEPRVRDHVRKALPEEQ
jgi:methionyl-tRNA synthetase